AEIQAQTAAGRADVCLAYITRRGRWYDASWKGALEKSGGVALNIGIHFFDLLHWLFGDVEQSKVHVAQPRKMAGVLQLQRARVRWFLSTDADDLPESVVEKGGYAHRSMTYEGQEIEFSDGFTELHTRVYEEILAGRGTGIRDTRPAIELAHAISRSEVTSSLDEAHPLIAGSRTLQTPFISLASQQAGSAA
ncbi:MAG: Gfo/Idh/MocA family oxidoreductase, partial [Pirellulales bacterium]|nr:Gfo/Idh/MocA family oxidoreductase [Pirellulales bacterium]